jgi:hypothetical protein
MVLKVFNLCAKSHQVTNSTVSFLSLQNQLRNMGQPSGAAEAAAVEGVVSGAVICT